MIPNINHKNTDNPKRDEPIVVQNICAALKPNSKYLKIFIQNTIENLFCCKNTSKLFDNSFV